MLDDGDAVLGDLGEVQDGLAADTYRRGGSNNDRDSQRERDRQLVAQHTAIKNKIYSREKCDEEMQSPLCVPCP